MKNEIENICEKDGCENVATEEIVHQATYLSGGRVYRDSTSTKTVMQVCSSHFWSMSASMWGSD